MFLRVFIKNDANDCDIIVYLGLLMQQALMLSVHSLRDALSRSSVFV